MLSDFDRRHALSLVDDMMPPAADLGRGVIYPKPAMVHRDEPASSAPRGANGWPSSATSGNLVALVEQRRCLTE